MSKDALQLPGSHVLGPDDFTDMVVLNAKESFRGERNNRKQGIRWSLPEDNAKASQPSEGEDADNVHGEVCALPPECDTVRIVAREWESWGDGVVGAGVNCGEKDLAPIASLEARTYNAGNIVPPGDVENQIGVGRVTGHSAGINGPLGAEAGV